MKTSTNPHVKTPVFYGWVIVAVCFSAEFGGTLMGAYALTVLLVPMSLDTGWSRTAIIGASFTASIVAALISPALGHLVDRQGVRPTLATSAFICGVTIMAIALVKDLWLYYLIFGLVNGFSRPLVQTLGVSVAIANWFAKRRPLVTAIVSMGIPLSGIVGVPLTTLVVVQLGWRPAWLFMGLVLIFLVALPTALFMREKPEDLGLLPDGKPGRSKLPVDKHAPGPTPWWGIYQTAQAWEGREALRTKAFWVVSLAPPFIALTGPTFATHVVAFWLDKGLSPTGAAVATSSFLIGTLGGRIFWGVVTAKLHIQYCYVLLGTIAFLGTVAIITAQSIQAAYAATLFFGLSAGGLMQLRLQVWPDYFGRKALGSIRGYSSPFELLGFAFGPLFAAWVFDNTGSYNGALGLYAILSILSTLAMLFFGRPPILPTNREQAQVANTNPS